MNITTALNDRIFLKPRADFADNSHIPIIEQIMKIHGETLLHSIKLIDENDEYDSFLVESGDKGYCVKISFDSVPIFYEFNILKGIEHFEISPYPIVKGEIFYGDKVYYTILTYEYSDNLKSIGVSNLFNPSISEFVDYPIVRLLSFRPPQSTWEHMDNNISYFEYHNINFDKILSYVDSNEETVFNFIRTLYKDIYDETFEYLNKNLPSLTQDRFVHGKLDSSTIIENSQRYKIINFDNSFVGSPFFDIANLTWEINATGLNEYDYVTNKIVQLGFQTDRLKAKKYLEEYKICKKIWMRKKFLDLIKDYVKEVIVLNNTRTDKMYKLGHLFSSNFYKFAAIPQIEKNKQTLVLMFENLILNN